MQRGKGGEEGDIMSNLKQAYVRLVITTVVKHRQTAGRTNRAESTLTLTAIPERVSFGTRVS